MATRTRLTRAESKARTRADLLAAANRVFHRNGYAATTVEQIAAEAGYTTGAVYSNFETKDDLFLALVDEAERADVSWITEDETAPSDISHATGRSADERAANLGRAMSRLTPDPRSIAMIMEMNAAALRSPRAKARVAEHNRTYFGELGAQLAALLDGDDVDGELLGLMAQTIYSGFKSHEALTGEPLGDHAYARAYRLLAELARDGMTPGRDTST